MANPQSGTPDLTFGANTHIPSTSDAPTDTSQELGRRPGRALLGWLQDPEASMVYLGRIPGPQDNVVELQRVVEQYRTAVASRPMKQLADAIQEMSDAALVAAIAARSDVQTAFAGLQWRPALVNLENVLSIQKIVHTDGLDARIGHVGNDENALLEICVPRDQPLPPEGGMMDQDQHGFTFSSLNPNLRFFGTQVHDAQITVPGAPVPTKAQAVTFFLSMGTSYLSVARYNDRCFIRDGYHRAVAFLRAGITIVPCILVEARNFAEVGGNPATLPYEVLFGPKPPYVADFWDDAVAANVTSLAIRKVLRVRGDEFVVAR